MPVFSPKYIIIPLSAISMVSHAAYNWVDTSGTASTTGNWIAPSNNFSTTILVNSEDNLLIHPSYSGTFAANSYNYGDNLAGPYTAPGYAGQNVHYDQFTGGSHNAGMRIDFEIIGDPSAVEITQLGGGNAPGEGATGANFGTGPYENANYQITILEDIR